MNRRAAVGMLVVAGAVGMSLYFAAASSPDPSDLCQDASPPRAASAQAPGGDQFTAGPPTGRPVARPIAAVLRTRSSDSSAQPAQETPRVTGVREVKDESCPGKIRWEITLSDGSKVDVARKPIRTEIKSDEIVVYFE
jgi:hypothetical protein